MAATVNMNQETFLIYGLLPLASLPHKIFLGKIRRSSRARSAMTLPSKMFRLPPCLIHLLPPTRSAMPIFLCVLLRMNKISHQQATTLLHQSLIHTLFCLKTQRQKRMIFARRVKQRHCRQIESRLLFPGIRRMTATWLAEPCRRHHATLTT